MDGGFISSSGSLIGASLETIGFYYQELVLDALTGPLTSSMGGLVYVIGGIVAMVTYILKGNYKIGLWLLLGPSLYFATIVPRTETYGSAWMFGSALRDTARAQAEASEVLDETLTEGAAQEPAAVSAVFAWYTHLVAEVVREIVDTMNEGREQTDYGFVTRMEIFGSIHNGTVDDPRLKDLIHHAFFRDCRALVEVARKVSDPRVVEDVEILQREYETRKAQPINLSHAAVEYVAGLRAAFPELYQAVLNNDHQAADDALAALSDDTAPPPDIFAEEYRAGIAAHRNSAFTCDQVWSFTRAGITLFARRLVVDHVANASSNGLNPELLLRDLGKITGIGRTQQINGGEPLPLSPAEQAEQLRRLYEAIATYILRNEINRGSTSAFVSDFVNKVEVRELEAPGYASPIELERQRSEAIEFEEKTRMMTLGSQLPLYQGLLLYFLATLFPFFALMLLIPGRHSGFLFWFSLWFWAKSWDIGFAIVMLLDDILFGIFSVAHETGSIKAEPGISGEISATFEAIAEMDPTFQLSTYYAIIGTALGAIPIVLAHFILGSLKAGTGLIAQGMEGYATHFGTGAFSQVSQGMIAAQSADAANSRLGAATRFAKNTMEGKRANTGSAVGAYRRSLSGGPGMNASTDMHRAETAQRWGFGQVDWSSANDLNFKTAVGARHMLQATGFASGAMGIDSIRASEIMNSSEAARRKMQGLEQKGDIAFQLVNGVGGKTADETMSQFAAWTTTATQIGSREAMYGRKITKNNQIANHWGALEIVWDPGLSADWARLDRDLAVANGHLAIGANAFSAMVSAAIDGPGQNEKRNKAHEARRKKGYGIHPMREVARTAVKIGVAGVGVEAIERYGGVDWITDMASDYTGAGGVLDGVVPDMAGVNQAFNNAVSSPEAEAAGSGYIDYMGDTFEWGVDKINDWFSD